jgi:hypothetical protein
VPVKPFRVNLYFFGMKFITRESFVVVVKLFPQTFVLSLLYSHMFAEPADSDTLYLIAGTPEKFKLASCAE